jgi:serine/threonine-protein kinase
MSPEQATGSSELDVRSDIYSLGAVMYFMATGQPPFPYPQPLKVMVAHASEEPVPPRALRRELPQQLEDLILRALEKRPEDRFQDVADLRDALELVPLDEPWNSHTAAQWWHDFGCPQRKALVAEAMELVPV